MESSNWRERGSADRQARGARRSDLPLLPYPSVPENSETAQTRTGHAHSSADPGLVLRSDRSPATGEPPAPKAYQTVFFSTTRAFPFPSGASENWLSNTAKRQALPGVPAAIPSDTPLQPTKQNGASPPFNCNSGWDMQTSTPPKSMSTWASKAPKRSWSKHPWYNKSLTVPITT
jgi:hypothetical protein